MAPGRTAADRARPASGPTAGEAPKKDVGPLLENLGRACSSLEDYDTGARMRRSMVEDDANQTAERKELLKKLPALDNFAAMGTTPEVIDGMKAVASVMEKLVAAWDGT